MVRFGLQAETWQQPALPSEFGGGVLPPAWGGVFVLGVWKLAALLCFPPGLVGQNAIPPGTILPLSLDTALNAAKAHAGQTIRATVMQDVPGTAIRRRSKVLGHVVEVSGAKGTAARLSFVFDTARAHGHELHFKSNLRAMASVMEVEEAQVPEEMSSRGLTPETWDTQQIGGDEVYRGGGPVAAGLTDVGVPTPWGVLDVPRARRGQP